MSATRWVEVSVHVAPPDAEAIAGLLGALAGGGAVIEPAIRPSDGDDFAYQLLDTASAVRAFFAAPLPTVERRSLRRRLASLPLSAPLPRLRYADVEERDWSQEWKRLFDVLHVGERLVLRPSWRPYEPRRGELVIELDPGRAFGTGQHPTTRLCLLALERQLRPGDRVIDVGAGSGVLAIAAARLGARSVRALDVDAEAVSVARANIARNGVEDVVRVAVGSLGDGGRRAAGTTLPATGLSAAAPPASELPAAEPSADLVVLNISSSVLVALMEEVAHALRPSGLLVGSGFIDEAATEVRAAAAAAGLRPLRVDADEEWRCIVARAL